MDQIKTILFNHLVAFLSSSSLMLMAINAFFGTVPPNLPTLREFPQWSWTWGIAFVRQFWSLHHPQAPPSTLNQSKEQ